MREGKYEVPEDLLYTKEHEWIRITKGPMAVVGITDYAAKMLHDIVYVSLPEVGREVTYMTPFGSVESIKTVSDLYSPLSGKVVKVNETLNNSPELVGNSPYGEGWIIEIIPSRFDEEVELLLSPRDYVRLIEKLSERRE